MLWLHIHYQVKHNSVGVKMVFSVNDRLLTEAPQEIYR